jgi:type IV secretory pathway TrbF-like protein
MSTQHLPRPKSYEDAETAFQKVMGDPRRLCRILAVALVGCIAVDAGLLLLNFRTASQQRERIVVRIDDVGRAQAVGFATSGATKVQPNETKYFLAQFVHDYYGRNRASMRDDFMRSLMFLNSPFATARMEEERRTKSIEKFIVGGEDEIEIRVNNIILGDLSHEPYTAQVDITKVYRDRAGNETKQEKYIEGITWQMSADVPNAAVLVNPLGFTILSLREDQAF